jgi:hypothetical protein
MNERRTSLLEGDESLIVPDNVIFVGCCNPFRLDFTQETQEGDDDIAVKHLKQGLRKSHMVYPICESLMGYIYDFGTLR